MTDPDEFTHALGAARDMTGHPGHDKLRRRWGVPEGGTRPTRPKTTPKGEGGNLILSNLMKAYQERSNAIGEANRPKAIAAHAEYEAGATYTELTKKYHLTASTLRDHWRKTGLNYRGRKVTK